MYADINNIDTNSMVIIVNPSNTEDNGKVYIKKKTGSFSSSRNSKALRKVIKEILENLEQTESLHMKSG